MAEPTSTCQGCGDTWPAANGPDATHCGNCPPWHCDRCNRTVDMTAKFNCDTCVMRFKDMPLADIKAIFAADGGFNIGGLGSETQKGSQ
jgi:hypothetical protein